MIIIRFVKTTFIMVLLVFSFLSITSGQQKEDRDFSKIKFEVVSQRWLTNGERGDSITLNIAVRVRLSNQSNKDVYFAAFENGEISPLGFHYTRKMGDVEWSRLSPDNSFVGNGYRVLILSPGMSIEYDIASMSLENVEQKFSVSLKSEKAGKRFEVFSDVFRPITKD